MPRYRRCREKFQSALRRLAVAEGDVRERLRGAHWFLRQLSEHEIPPELRKEWTEVLQLLTARGPDVAPDGTVYSNAVVHTLSGMRNSTGRRIAERIYMMVRALG